MRRITLQRLEGTLHWYGDRSTARKWLVLRTSKLAPRAPPLKEPMMGHVHSHELSARWPPQFLAGHIPRPQMAAIRFIRPQTVTRPDSSCRNSSKRVRCLRAARPRHHPHSLGGFAAASADWTGADRRAIEAVSRISRGRLFVAGQPAE